MKNYIETNKGVITTQFYDDGIGKGVEILLDGQIVCMLDVMEGKYAGARLIVYSKEDEDEPTDIIDINKNPEEE